jgi:deoxyribodipyrimidine photo-lyase
MRTMVWFRSDLRVRDHAALFHARRRASRGVVGVFTICPRQWREHDWGPMKAGFVLGTLRALGADLERLRIPLRLVTVPTFAEVPAALLRLAEETGCDELHFGNEYEVNEQRRDGAVERAFAASGREVVRHTTKVLTEPGGVRTNDGRWYTVFTPFKKRLYAAWDELVPVALPAPKACEATACPSDEVPDAVEGLEPTAEMPERPDLWPGGESEATARLKRFVAQDLDAYADRRDAPGTPGTSTLSPYLAVGAIGPGACVSAAIEASGGRPDAGGKGPTHWISEIVWREFYQHLLVGFPHVCMGRSFNRAYDAMPWLDDQAHFEAWRRGLTGVPIVDAAMRQLNTTGWMHNRCRMIVAMYLTKNLLLDWRLGERYFMQRLVDGDLASNNGGWQWSSSTGTDAAPYFRVYNPITQSETHDPDGRYIRRFVPELADVPPEAIHDPHERLKTGLFGALDYPKPLVDLKATRERAIEAFRAFRG